MKVRTARWEARAIAKFKANKHKNKKSMHPQVRRQLEKES